MTSCSRVLPSFSNFTTRGGHRWTERIKALDCEPDHGSAADQPPPSTGFCPISPMVNNNEQLKLFIAKAREIEGDEKSAASDQLLGRLAKMKLEPKLIRKNTT
jgi:hypothetical protein